MMGEVISDMEKIKFTLNSLASTFHSYLELNKDTNKLQDFMDKKYKEILKEKEKTNESTGNISTGPKKQSVGTIS